MSHPSKSPSQPNLWILLHLDIKPQKNISNLLKKKILPPIINHVLVEGDLIADLEEAQDQIMPELMPLKLKERKASRSNKMAPNPSEEEDEKVEEEDQDAILTLLPQTKIQAMLKLVSTPLKMNRDKATMKAKNPNHPSDVEEVTEEAEEAIVVEEVVVVAEVDNGTKGETSKMKAKLDPLMFRPRKI